MAKYIPILLFTVLYIILAVNPCNAQTDSEYNALIAKWVVLGEAGNLDSALYYANKLQTISENRYGENSYPNAICLAGILAYTYQLMGNNNKAYYLYKKGISVFEVGCSF